MTDKPLIICDNRETGVFKLLDTTKVEPVCSQLDIGDFIIKGSSRDIIIERKTMDDLSSSIIDSRYSEQKKRLMACSTDTRPSTIMYIIENSFKKSKRGVPHSTLLSAMISTMLKNGFFVMRTADMNETAQVLVLIAQKFSQDTGPVVCVPSAKRSDFSQDVYTNMLCCIPGVNIKLACNIKNKYPTMLSLYKAYELCDHNKRDQMLCDVHKIGPKMSKSIRNNIVLESYTE